MAAGQDNNDNLILTCSSSSWLALLLAPAAPETAASSSSSSWLRPDRRRMGESSIKQNLRKSDAMNNVTIAKSHTLHFRRFGLDLCITDRLASTLANFCGLVVDLATKLGERHLFRDICQTSTTTNSRGRLNPSMEEGLTRTG